jgi:chemotaxis response regulator CheB
MASTRNHRTHGGRPRNPASADPLRSPVPSPSTLVTIGASAGGHRALAALIRDLPADLPAAVIILLHIGTVVEFILPRWLRQFGHLPVTLAEDNVPIEPRHVYIAPPGQYVSVEGECIHLTAAGTKRRTESIDALFFSAADAYKDRAVGVVLTGRGHDGSAGLKAIHDAGGLTIVQDPDEAEHRDMPANALKALPVDFCLHLADIAPTLDLFARANATFETGLAASLRLLEQRTALLVRLLQHPHVDGHRRRLVQAEVETLKEQIAKLHTVLSKNHPAPPPNAQ